MGLFSAPYFAVCSLTILLKYAVVQHSLFADDLKLFSQIALVSAGKDLQESLFMLESWCSAICLAVSHQSTLRNVVYCTLYSM